LETNDTKNQPVQKPVRYFEVLLECSILFRSVKLKVAAFHTYEAKNKALEVHKNHFIRGVRELDILEIPASLLEEGALLNAQNQS
jgi:hypothetical protein